VFKKKYPGVPLFYVDAGDFTGDPNVPGEKQTDALIDAMNRLGYQVSALGVRELALGWDAFAARKAKAKFPFVSANLVWQDNGQTVVDPFVVVKTPLRPGAKGKEVRIAYTGVVPHNPAYQGAGPGGRKIVTTDPLEAAAQVVPKMREKADVVVVLSSLDLDKGRALARRAKQADLVLGGSGPAQSRNDDFPEDSIFGTTRIQTIGDQGKNLGEVRLFFKEKNALASVQRSVVGLTREWPDDPDLGVLMASTREAVNDYNKAQAQAANPFNTPPEAGAAPGVAPAAPATAAATYTGSDRCRTCHAKEFTLWSQSKHSHAFEILITNKQDYNPRCVGCHVVGYGRPGGFVNAAATPLLVHVGCESCHGPSSLHPDPIGAGFGTTTTEACRTCHTPENSPDYDPGTYIPKVKHWDEARAAR
jgi:cytochrome c554/c'-like protein